MGANHLIAGLIVSNGHTVHSGVTLDTGCRYHTDSSRIRPCFNPQRLQFRPVLPPPARFTAAKGHGPRTPRVTKQHQLTPIWHQKLLASGLLLVHQRDVRREPSARVWCVRSAAATNRARTRRRQGGGTDRAQTGLHVLGVFATTRAAHGAKRRRGGKRQKGPSCPGANGQRDRLGRCSQGRTVKATGSPLHGQSNGKLSIPEAGDWSPGRFTASILHMLVSVAIGRR